MSKQSIFFEFNLRDKVSSKLLKMKNVIEGVNKQAGRFSKYLQDTGNAYFKLNATSDALGRMRDNLNAVIAPGIMFEQNMADLSAITGIAGKDLKQLGDAARKVGRQSGIGAAEAAEAFKLLASNISVDKIGIDGLKILQRETITLAHASGLALSESANAMAGTINQFGLSANEANRVINVLAAGAKYGAAEIPELAMSFKAVGSTAAVAGLSIEKTAGALEVLSKANIKGAEAGIQLRNILLSMQSKLGIDFKVQDISAALQALEPRLNDASYMTKLFGRENIAAASFLIKNASAVSEMTSKVTNTNVATEQAAIRTDTYAERMKKVKAYMDEFKISVFNLTGSMVPLLEISAAGLQHISLMLPALKMMKDAFVLLRAVSIKQLIVSKAIVVWQKMQTAWNYIMATSIKVVNFVTSLNPIILIASLVAMGVILMIKYWDKIKDYMIAFVKFSLKYLNPFSWIFALVNKFFPDFFKDVKAFFTGIGKWLYDWGIKLLEKMKKMAKSIKKFFGFGDDEKKTKIIVEKKGGSVSVSDDHAISNGLDTGGDLGYETDSTLSNISGGGKQHVNVSVNIEKLVERLYVQAATVQEGAEEVRDIIQSELNRALNGVVVQGGV